MTTAETETVVLTRRIAARPHIVFSYFTDADKMIRWKGIAAEIDAATGGKYSVDVLGPTHVAAGSFLAIEPYTRVIFTWGWEGGDVPPGSSVVEVTFEPDGDATVLTLSHRDLPVNARAPHAVGWNHYLDRLVVAAGGGEPGRDEWLDNPPGGE